MRSAISLVLIPLLGCSSARVTPAPVSVYRSPVASSVVLEFPQSTHVAVFAAYPGEPLVRVSPDDTAAVRRLTLPVPAQRWGRMLHAGDRPTVLVGTMADQYSLFGQATTTWGNARPVWEPYQSASPSGRRGSITWLTVLLEGPRTAEVDSIAATIRGPAQYREAQLAEELAVALNLAPERVRVVSLN